LWLLPTWTIHPKCVHEQQRERLSQTLSKRYADHLDSQTYLLL
jgi:hypothetical protein